MTLEWSPLSISKPDLLRREVDNALSMLQAAIDAADPSISSLIEGVRRQVRALEAFYTEYNDGKETCII